MTENDLSYLIANDEQAEILSDVIKHSSVSNLEGIEKLEFLHNTLSADSRNMTMARREAVTSSGLEPLQDSQSLLNSLATISERLKSIRSQKEKIAVLENKKQVLQKTCCKELNSFLPTEVLTEDDPSAIARELERIETQRREEARCVRERLEKMEKFADDVQARLKTQTEESDLRLTNVNNLESDLQSVLLNDFLLFKKHWIAEDTIQLRLGHSRINVRVKFNKATGDITVEDVEGFDVHADIKNLLENTKRWNSIASLTALFALRRRLDTQIRHEVELLQNEFPLDWQPQKCALQLLARGGRGQSVVCLLNLSDLSRVELSSVTGLDIDSASACAQFKPPLEGSLRCWIDALVDFCAVN